jgi:hypothetical protein
LFVKDKSRFCVELKPFLSAALHQLLAPRLTMLKDGFDIKVEK